MNWKVGMWFLQMVMAFVLIIIADTLRDIRTEVQIISQSHHR